MSKARDLANAGTALTTVSATELGYLDGVTSAVQTQINSKEPTLPSQTSNSGKYLTTDGTNKSWGTVSQYALPSQTGNAGKFLTTNGTAESWGSAGINWNLRRNRTSSSAWYSIASNGSTVYVIVGQAGKVSSSTDSGVTWTDRTSNTANLLYKVTYGNGLFVAVGSSGTIITSSDGITWTSRTSNMGTNNIYDVAYGNNTWVAVGQGGGTNNTGGITYSTDGTTWTRKSQSLTIGTTYYCVLYNGTNWIVGDDDNGTNNYLYANGPSGTWTLARASTAGGVYQVFYDGTRTLFLDPSAALYSTTSATLSSSTVMSGSTLRAAGADKTLNYYYNGKVYFGGELLTSVDTAPVNTNQPVYKQYGLSPSTSMGSNGGTSVEFSTLLVNASGYVIAGVYGDIWTSF